MSISRLLVVVIFLLAPCAGAIAKEELPPVKVHHEAGVDYVYGGMDPLERKAMARIAEPLIADDAAAAAPLLSAKLIRQTARRRSGPG